MSTSIHRGVKSKIPTSVQYQHTVMSIEWMLMKGLTLDGRDAQIDAQTNKRTSRQTYKQESVEPIDA